MWAVRFWSIERVGIHLDHMHLLIRQSGGIKRGSVYTAGLEDKFDLQLLAI